MVINHILFIYIRVLSIYDKIRITWESVFLYDNYGIYSLSIKYRYMNNFIYEVPRLHNTYSARSIL